MKAQHYNIALYYSSLQSPPSSQEISSAFVSALFYCRLTPKIATTVFIEAYQRLQGSPWEKILNSQRLSSQDMAKD